MKLLNSVLALLAANLLFLPGCGDKSLKPAAVPLDYEKESIKLMDEVAPRLVGRWKLGKVRIKYQNHTHQNQLQLTKDTTLENLATLELQPAATPRFAPRQARHPEFEGMIYYQGKSYPVYFYLLASPGRVVNQKGPEAFFLLEYNFPVGSRVPDREETFLREVGLVGENFSLQTLPGQPAMLWSGLNRGIEQIELRKQP